jgi:hypothetical protein
MGIKWWKSKTKNDLVDRPFKCAQQREGENEMEGQVPTSGII